MSEARMRRARSGFQRGGGGRKALSDHPALARTLVPVPGPGVYARRSAQSLREAALTVRAIVLSLSRTFVPLKAASAGTPSAPLHSIGALLEFGPISMGALNSKT
ncbi:hypothetical protein FRC10_011643 [Ceratobasidium sp. 414]|nr:hypothetical protein FRC10_011643 [Ceratobasidium sp. 414]